MPKPVQNVRRAAEGKIDGVQIQMLSHLGVTWGMGEPRFTAQQVIDYTRKVTQAGGAVTWDVPVELNGAWLPGFAEHLKSLGEGLARR